jgi:hypothetical protein
MVRSGHEEVRQPLRDTRLVAIEHNTD